MELTPEELLEDAESIAGLVLVGGPEEEKRSLAYTFSYPAQEHKLGKGRDVIDPATGDDAGEILRLDRDARELVLKRGPKLKDVPLPACLIPGGPYYTADQEDALARFGRSLLAGDHAYPALETILDRVPFDRDVQTSDIEELKALVRSLDGRHLVIQGPPGSGKTWTSGRLIADLVARGKTVGVASTSHKAIHKLLDEVEASATELGLDFTGLKKASGGNPESEYANRPLHERHRRRTTARASTSPAGRHGTTRARRTSGRSTTSSSTRPARSRSPTRSRWGPPRGTSSWSATPSSSPRSSRARIRAAPSSPS